MKVLPHFLLWTVGLARATTQTSEAERACLSRGAAGKRRLAEIGVWHGVTTCRLCQAMADDAVLYAIDPYPRGRLGVSLQQRIAHAEVGKIRRGNVVWIRLTGAAAAAQLAAQGDANFDFVFIDGDHSYDGLKQDWEGWSALIAPGGLIALHDSQSSSERNIESAGSVRFTREVIAQDRRFAIVETVDTLTVLRRTAAP
jgi:predicted O-methyltransferase YrrM